MLSHLPCQDTILSPHFTAPPHTQDTPHPPPDHAPQFSTANMSAAGITNPAAAILLQLQTISGQMAAINTRLDAIVLKVQSLALSDKKMVAEPVELRTRFDFDPLAQLTTEYHPSHLTNAY